MHNTTLTPFRAQTRRERVLVAALLLCTLSRAHGAEEVSAATDPFYASYGMVTVDSEETVTALQALVGERARLVYYRPNNQLLVYGPPEAHQLVREALRDVVTDPRNVRVEVSIDEQSQAREASASAIAAANVVVSSQGVGATVSVVPRAEARATVSAALTTQHLLLRSGGAAEIRVGETVPFVNELVVWGRREGVLAQEVTLRQVGASLQVRARIIGDGPLIQVTLTPELSGVSTPTAPRIRFTGVATTVNVRAGETVTVASFGEHADFYRLFLAGAGRASQATDKRITLRVTLDAPAAAAIPPR